MQLHLFIAKMSKAVPKVIQMTMRCSRSLLKRNTVGLCEVQSRIYVVNRWKKILLYPDNFPKPLAPWTREERTCLPCIIQTQLTRNTTICDECRWEPMSVRLSCRKTSRVTCVTLVLWVGNETLRWTLRERPLRTESENPYRITPIHWLMARRRLWRNDVVRSYWRTRHPLLRFLCRKESCRQREELGSKRSVSFPTQRTRVTQVTRDVLFHR